MQTFCWLLRLQPELAAVQVQLSRQRTTKLLENSRMGLGIVGGIRCCRESEREKNETFKYREENGSLKQLVESRVFRVEPEHFALCKIPSKLQHFFSAAAACFYCSTIVRSSVAMAVHCVYETAAKRDFAASNRILVGISIVQLQKAASTLQRVGERYRS